MVWILVTGLCAISIEPDLPQVVAAETGESASGFDELVDAVAHLPGPVLVMADGDRAAIAVEGVRIAVQVGLGDVGDRVARMLGPHREGPFVGGPAGVGVMP